MDGLFFYHYDTFQYLAEHKRCFNISDISPNPFRNQSFLCDLILLQTLGPKRLELQSETCPSSGVSVVDAGFWLDGLVSWLDVTWQWWSSQGQAGRLAAAGLMVIRKDKTGRAQRRALTHISSQAGWTVVQSASLCIVVLFYRWTTK